MKNKLTLLLLFISGLSFGQEIEVITQEKIQGLITILTYSPDGSLIASGSAKENSIKVWDIASGKIIGKLQGHEGATTAINFSADGKKLVSSAKDNLLIVWDVVNWEIVDSIRTKSPINWFVNDQNSTSIFYSGDNTGNVEKWNFESINSPEVLYSEMVPILKLDASKTHLVSGNSGGKLTLFDIAKNEISISKKVHQTAVKGLKFFDNGTKLISSGGGGGVHIWTANNLDDSNHLKASSSLITAFDANEKVERFVVATNTRTIRVFDFNGKEIFEFRDKLEDEKNTETIRALQISPDGSTVASSGFNKARSFSVRGGDNVIRIWDMNRGSLYKLLEGRVNPIYSFDFHPTKNELVTLGDDQILTFWDFEVAEKFGEYTLVPTKREIPPKMKLWKKENIKKGGSKLLGTLTGGKFGDDGPLIRDNAGKDLGTGMTKRVFTEHPMVKFSSKGKFLITKLPRDEIRYYNVEKTVPEYIGPLWSYQPNINQMLCSPDEKYLAVLGSGDSAVSIIDLTTGEFVRKLDTPGPEGKLRYITEAKSLAFSPDGTMLAVCFNTSKTFVYRVGTWSLLFENLLPGNIGMSNGAFVNFTEDGRYMVVNSTFGIKKYDTKKFELFNENKLAIQGHSIPIDRPSDYVVTHHENYLYIENVADNTYNKVLRAGKKDITHVGVSPDGKYGITTSSGQFFIINPATAEQEILLVADGDNFIFKTAENYYKVSKEGFDLVTFRIGNRAYPFEQFDAVFNRPDLVLKKLNCEDEELMALYKLAYEKRIKKLGLQETSTVTLSDIPTLSISNTVEIPAITETSSIDVNMVMKDAKGLMSYNVYINNVPIYGKNGKKLAGEKSLNKTEKISLVHGINKVQISCRNKGGYESLMQTFYVDKAGEKPQRNLYLITIGTSEYQDDRFNLTYPVKDASDLVSLMDSSNTELYANVKTKSLHNQDVTVENIAALGDFLKESGPDDVVIVFVAGHGVLDENFDYYFGTYDMDFNSPAGRGLAYDKLEGILDGIKANKKILIMDTCHSGEIDKEDVFFVESKDEEKEDEDIAFRAVGPAVEENSNATPSRLSSILFNDLRRGTGSTVISSAGGTEFAMESDEWKNGLFTYSLLLGLKTGKADLDGNGEIMLMELQEYVVTKVSALSHGKQVPNTRIQNMELDFRLW